MSKAAFSSNSVCPSFPRQQLEALQDCVMPMHWVLCSGRSTLDGILRFHLLHWSLNMHLG